MIHWFNNQGWYGFGANVIQYTTIFTWGIVMWHVWHHRCAEPGCIRPGQVPKKGTADKVCKKHAIEKGHVH